MDAGPVAEFLSLFVSINLVLMVLNLVPIPPLDGSKVLFAFMDPRTAWRVRPVFEQYGFAILLGAMLLPIFGGNTLIGIVFKEVLVPLQGLLVGR
jgi:Zn-dependent protease